MNRICRIVVVLALLVSAAGFCGGRNQAGSSAGAASNDVVFYHWEPNNPGLAYFNDAMWVKELANRTGVNLNFRGPFGGEDYTTAANLLIASGDLPDLMLYNWVNYNGGIEGAVNDGLAVNYGKNQDYLNQIPNWMRLVNSDENIRRDLTLSTGGMAQFATIAEDRDVSGYSGVMIRQDWLDRVGLPVPTTVDELHTALLAFKQRDANGNGDPNDEIPLSDSSNHLGFIELIAGWGLRYNMFYPDPQNPGRVTYWTLYRNGQAFTEMLTAFAQWQREGLLDPDFLTQDDTQRVSKIVNNTVGSSFAYSVNYNGWRDNIKELQPNAGNVKLVALPRLKGPDGKPYHIMDSYIRLVQLHDSITISPQSERAGKVPNILKLLDYMYSPEGSELINFGVEGIAYTKDARGNHIWTDAIARDPQLPLANKVLQYANPFWGSFPKIHSYEAWKMSDAQEPDSLAAHLEYTKGDDSILMPYVLLSNAQAEEYNAIMTDVNTAIEEFYTAVIRGARPVSDTTAFLNQLNSMGIGRAQQIYQAAYDAYMRK
jgi:putative aldouronate transport system substrate-binding protein